MTGTTKTAMAVQQIEVDVQPLRDGTGAERSAMMGTWTMRRLFERLYASQGGDDFLWSQPE